MGWYMKLKVKLSLMVIAIMVVGISGISFTLLRRASSISRDLSSRGIKYLASDVATYWKAQEDAYIRVLSTLANIMGNYESLPAENRRDQYDGILLSTLQAEENMFMIYAIFRPNVLDGMDNINTGRRGSTAAGQYAMNFNKELGGITGRLSADVNAAMAYIDSSNARKLRVEHPIPRNVLGKDTFLVRYMIPIINQRTNEVVGGVGCLLDIAGIQTKLQEELKQYEEIYSMAIYSSNSFIIASYAPEQVGQMLKDVETSYGSEMETAYQAVVNGTGFSTNQFVQALNTNAELIIQPFQIGNSDITWSVMIGTLESFTLKEVYEITQFTVVLAIIAILITAIVLFLVFNSVTKPIVRVADTLKNISEGEGDLTRTIVVSSRDEIGNLAHYFNLTLEKIKNLIKSIKGQASVLLDVGENLSSNMTETAAAINEITSNIQSIKGRVLNQSASVTETNATMEQITVTIEKLNEHVEKQTYSMSQSSSAIEEMLANIKSVTDTLVRNGENVKELSGASEVGRTGLEEVASDIQEISRESEGLLEINAVMENIASQTNLLSMNAAIEAAHAGEAGKGFAVVADEIRKLAESSSEQSKTISDVLKKMKKSVDKITKSTETVIHKFEAIDSKVRIVSDQEENIRDSMQEQGEGSKQILAAMSMLNDITQQVKIGSVEMLEGSREVIQESRNLEMMTQEITGGMNEMAVGAEQINGAVNQANGMSVQNKESIDLLVKEISLFKIE